jgi:CspA family cold shock protein
VLIARESQPDSDVRTGRVKWYDADRGYGFVVPDGGDRDILVHASCVKASGRASIPEGAHVSLRVVQGDRGLQAVELIDVEEEEPHYHEEEIRPSELAIELEGAGDLVAARVKWFDKLKGFGFVNVFGDSADVFIHMETLRRCGFNDLMPGEGVAVRTVDGPRGLMAVEVRTWEAALHPTNGAG